MTLNPWGHRPVRWFRASLENQLVDLTVSVEAVGLKSVVREHVDGVADDQRTVDAAVGLGGCKAAELDESIRVWLAVARVR